MNKLELGKYYSIEDGKLEFSREYLWRRGYCCNKKCKNCPYLKDASIDLKIIELCENK